MSKLHPRKGWHGNEKRSTRERFSFTTPQHLLDAARAICVELDREYPYLAELHHNEDGTYTLFSLHTIKRQIARHNGEEWISNTGWDVDWIERDKQYAYHDSSGGGSLRHKVSGIYWRHPLMLHAVREETARYAGKEFRKRNKTRRLRRIPAELVKDPYGRSPYPDLMAMLESTGIDAKAYLCAICKEYLPERDEYFCEHVWPCDSDAVLRGPGSADEDYQEPCDDEDCFWCQRQREKSAA